MSFWSFLQIYIIIMTMKLYNKRIKLNNNLKSIPYDHKRQRQHEKLKN